MKKAFFAGLTVLLALVMITCDSWPEKSETAFWDGVDTKGVRTGVKYDANGKELLEFTFGGTQASKGRALDPDRAEADSALYEVVFTDGTDFYRATWLEGQIGRLTIPVGEYDNLAGFKAVMFAGHYQTKTLLGTGVITDPADGKIDETTKAIEFSLEGLEASAATSLTTSATFTKSATDVKIKYTNYLDPIEVPLYIVNGAATTTYIFTMPSDTTGLVVNSTTGLYLAPRLLSKAITTAYPSEPSTGFSVSAGSISFAPSTGVCSLSFPNPAPAKGYSWVALEIPVKAIADDEDFIEWFIRGGTQNYFYMFDAPDYLSGTGGGILLGTTETTGIASITISGKY